MMALYRLFLDDERFPARGTHWSICRSFDAAVQEVQTHGVPAEISFDHDLGEGKSGHDFAKWLCDYIYINNIELPENFRFFVHSMNPIGAENIQKYMDGFLKHYRG